MASTETQPMNGPRVDIYNAYVSSTSLVQYIGNAGKVVAISGFIAFNGVLIFADLILGAGRNVALETYKDIILGTGQITGITVTGRTQITTNSNGVASWVLWTGGFSSTDTMHINVEEVQ
jgi:hypothetical protein